MILREDGDAVLCVGQASHAWLAGQLARAWGGAGFDLPEPFEEVCLGVEQHDVGMAEADRAPRPDSDTGRPLTFLRLPVAEHLALWAAAPGRVLTQSPYAALLVSLRGSALQRRRAGDPRADTFLAGQERWQRALLDALGEDPARARRNARVLWALDFVSLALLMEDWRPGPVAAPTRHGEPDAPLRVHGTGPWSVTVDPWPFTGDGLRVRCAARRLRERCRDQAALDAALHTAPWETLELTLAPADNHGR